MLPDLTQPGFWWNFGVRVARVIEISIAFELLVLLVNYWLGRRLAPALVRDARRDPAWRVKRRERLRRTPCALVRGVLYTLGGLVILDVFHARMIPVYVVLVLTVGGGIAVTWGLLREAAMGYALLLDDAVAPGDELEVGDLRGVVESVGWRGLRLRTAAGDLHTLGYTELKAFQVYAPREQASKPGAAERPPVRRRDEGAARHG